MALLADLITKGYFPKELPPPFHTRDLAFLENRIPRSWRTSAKGLFRTSCELERYSHKRTGYNRRTLSFPNPVLFYHLAEEIANSWATIRRHLAGGSWSATRPTRISPRTRAFSTHGTGPKLHSALARVRQNARYMLKADIARFYPSIYTHAIPWIMYGKIAAKARKNPTASLGNRLDYWIRMGQSRQTVGIPIGPDTSWLASELVLAGIEQAFVARFGRRPPGCVLIDDFELGFKNLPDAEQALADLEAVLNEYELSLNMQKTQILALPQPLGSVWTEELSTFAIRSNPSRQATDLVRYFNRAFEYARERPDAPVINYAIARLKGASICQENWSLYQALLLQCATVEPASLQFVEDELRRQRAKGQAIDLDVLADCMETIIATAAPLGHTSEVSWALWIAIIFGAHLGKETAKVVSSMEDSFVALTALHAESLGLFSAPLDRTTWQAHQTGPSLWQNCWVLAYEANKKGWLPSAVSPDHVDSDPQFVELKNRDVSFYEDGLAAAPAGSGFVPLTTAGYPMPR